MKTYVPKQGDIQRAWWVVDASGMTLGRLSTVLVMGAPARREIAAPAERLATLPARRRIR